MDHRKHGLAKRNCWFSRRLGVSARVARPSTDRPVL